MTFEIGLVLGISASTLFQAALIPGLLILGSILVTNIVVNRRYAYEGGGAISTAEWAGNIARAIRSGWYAFLVPGIIFYGIFSGRLTPTVPGIQALSGCGESRMLCHWLAIQPWEAVSPHSVSWSVSD